MSGIVSVFVSGVGGVRVWEWYTLRSFSSVQRNAWGYVGLVGDSLYEDVTYAAFGFASLGCDLLL